MILIRGINGDTYAQTIKNGIVSFGDLLSVLLEPVKTGYALSDYEESYVKLIFANIFGANFNPSPQEFKHYFNSQLTLNPIISNLYLTYFHILNQNSINWLENFSDETSFIYIIPKLDKISNNMITTNLLGRRIEYVKDFWDYDFLDFEMSTLGIVPMINKDLEISGLSDFDAIGLYCEQLFNIFKAIFTRVINQEYNEQENEFRIIYKFDTTIRSDGILRLNQKREYPFLINNTAYNGHPFSQEIKNVFHPDIFLEPPVPLKATTYMNELMRGSKIELKRSFVDVDIKAVAKRYGYIGNKDQCKNFIELLNKQKTERQMLKCIKKLKI